LATTPRADGGNSSADHSNDRSTESEIAKSEGSRGRSKKLNRKKSTEPTTRPDALADSEDMDESTATKKRKEYVTHLSV